MSNPRSPRNSDVCVLLDDLRGGVPVNHYGGESLEMLVSSIAGRCDEIVARWKRERVDHHRTKGALDAAEAKVVSLSGDSEETRTLKAQVASLQGVISGEDGLESQLQRVHERNESLHAENIRLVSELRKMIDEQRHPFAKDQGCAIEVRRIVKEEIARSGRARKAAKVKP